MSDHFLTRCSCGIVIEQCRCPGPKTEVIVQYGCPLCKEQKQLGGSGPMTIRSIGGLLLRNESSTGVSTCPMGFAMNQNRLAVPVWSYAMELYRPSRIYELGSYNGGFTIALAFAGYTEGVNIYSIDQSEAPSEQWREIAKCLNIRFYQGDIFDSEDMIAQSIASPGRSFLLCDGGDKAREFKMFAKYLKPGDVIAAHDLHTPYWPFEEIREEYVKDTIAEQKLVRWLPELFDLAGWMAFKKS